MAYQNHSDLHPTPSLGFAGPSTRLLQAHKKQNGGINIHGVWDIISTSSNWPKSFNKQLLQVLDVPS